MQPRNKHWCVLGTGWVVAGVALGSLMPGVSAAQSGKGKPVRDPAKLEGKILNKINPDDVLVLGILGRSLINEAQVKGERVPLAHLQLLALGVKAYNAKDYETAYRYGTRFVLLRRGITLDEGTEVASAFDFKLDRKIVSHEDTLTALLQPIFTLGTPLSGTYTARLTLLSLAGNPVAMLPAVAIKDMVDVRVTVPVRGLKDGKYTVQCELVSPAGQSLVTSDRPFLVHAEVRPRVNALAAQLADIKAKDQPSEFRRQATREALEFIVELFQRTLTEYVAPMSRASHPMVTRLRGMDLNRYLSEPFDINKDLDLARDLAEGLLRGGDPLATRTGDLHLAYRSAVDQTLQPFRVYVPSGYNPARKYPLVVALHGATGDENTYMDRYARPGTNESLFKKLGEERGYLLVTPNGRGTFGGYNGASERDVLDVLDRVLKLYSVDPRQVFLTGHSMGAAGTWLIGFRHPERFAALAPLAGRPQDLKSIPLAKAPTMPVLMFHGGKDTISTPQGARELAKMARKELKHFKYVEHPADDHFVIGVTSMPAIFDFFDARRKSPR